MKEIFYTDPHHGMTLNAHTTPASRRALQESISDTVRSLLSDKAVTTEDHFVICGGDFYHKHQNPEQVLLDSAYSFNRTDVILEGNHDVSNVKGAVSSLQLMAVMTDPREPNSKVTRASYNESTVGSFSRGDKTYWAVPHHVTQGAFDKALDNAAAKADESSAKYKLLILHCNYDNNFAVDETSLNLLRSKAEKLLTSFDYLLIGHEHNFRTDFSDRVIVLGCPHPTNFGDICDKFALEITDDCDMELIPTWLEHRATEVDWKEAELLPLEFDFLRVTGEVHPGEVPALAKIIKNLWRSTSAFAIKSEVKILAPDKVTQGPEKGSTWNIREVIEQELKDSDLSDLWNEVITSVERAE